MLVNDVYNSVFQVNFNGLGFPQAVYNEFASVLNSGPVSNGAFTCN